MDDLVGHHAQIVKGHFARAQWNVWGQNVDNRSSTQILASQVFIVISADL